jgi:acyl carrier protein
MRPDNIVSVLQSIRPEFEFLGVDDFFSRGMLDSFDLTTLISALEEKYGIVIDADDIVPNNFQSVEAIEKLLAKHKVSDSTF